MILVKRAKFRKIIKILLGLFLWNGMIWNYINIFVYIYLSLVRWRDWIVSLFKWYIKLYVLRKKTAWIGAFIGSEQISCQPRRWSLASSGCASSPYNRVVLAFPLALFAFEAYARYCSAKSRGRLLVQCSFLAHLRIRILRIVIEIIS